MDVGLVVIAAATVLLVAAFGGDRASSRMSSGRPRPAAGSARGTAARNGSLAALEADLHWSSRLDRGPRRWLQLLGRAGSATPMLRGTLADEGW